MPRNISIPTITTAVLKGIRRAHRDYSTWSGGFWLWRAPEYFLVTYIAQQLSKNLGPNGPWYLTMENGAKQAMKDAGAFGKGRLHNKIRASGRFDLLVWWGGDTPRAPIEIKRQVTLFKQIRADVDRIDRVIHRKKAESKIQFGIVAFCTSFKSWSGSSAKKTVESRIQQIKEELSNHISENTTFYMRQEKIRVEDESAWTAVAFVIKPKKGSA